MNNNNICSSQNLSKEVRERNKHIATSPILSNDKKISNDEKIKQIEHHFSEIIKIMGIDLSYHSIKDTPSRIAKMYINEIFKGLDNNNFPKIRLFDDISTNDKRMILTKDISINSICEHHFLPMIGKAHIAYIPNKKIIGLSKINRIVDYFSRQPQLQERLTTEIASCLCNILNNNNVAVFISLKHLCLTMRGANDAPSTTESYCLKGEFQTDTQLRLEFLSQIKN